ncbi:MAG: hypothetical protein LBU28_02875, partial [Spirochaetaceae bacterium]|nr:hypothetical protein [Spirochaetaceae bacterium]
GSSREEAIKAAIKECINQDILKEFLETHGTEVTSMLFTEWNLEDALAVEREEGWEEGRQEGLEEGLEKGRQEATAQYAEQIRRLEEEIHQLRGV